MPQKPHIEYLKDREDAMRFGLMDSRPHSEISILTYVKYAKWFLLQYHTNFN